MRSQKWFPDTCECVIEQMFDGETLVSQIALDKCAAHQSVENHLVPETVRSENVLKNVVMNELLNSFPLEHVDLRKSDEGDDVRQFKKKEEPTFSFDESRKLKVKIPVGISIDTVSVKSKFPDATDKILFE